jgi:hypothetical protein
MILARFIGKKNWQNRRTRSAPRRGLPETQAPSAGYLAGGSYSSHSAAGRFGSGPPGSTRTRSSAGPLASFDMPAAAAGEAGPAEMHVQHVDHPCEELLDRRPCFAVAQIPCGKQVRQAWLDRVRRICSQQIAGRCVNRACLYRARFFEMCCSARRRLDNPRRRRPGRRYDGRIGQRRSVVEHRRGCFEMRAGRRERQNPQQSGGRNAACIERGRSNVSRQRWHGGSHAGSEHKLPIRWRQVVEPALYTVEGRQAGDLPPRCGTALIRHQTRKTWQPHDDCD